MSEPPVILVVEERGARRVTLRDEVTIGRGADSGLTLAARNVSRRHARLLWNGDAAFVEDLGSRNGTFVNGERVGARRRLRDGDVVRIGDELLRYAEPGVEPITDPPAATPPPLPRRATPPPVPSPAPAAASPAPAPAPRRWKDVLAGAVRALTGRETE